MEGDLLIALLCPAAENLNKMKAITERDRENLG